MKNEELREIIRTKLGLFEFTQVEELTVGLAGRLGLPQITVEAAVYNMTEEGELEGVGERRGLLFEKYTMRK